MDKKEARIILGVNKETSRNDIEKKYSILLKKHRAASLAREMPSEDAAGEGAPESSGSQVLPNDAQKASAHEEYTFEQVTEAYNVLMGYEVVIKEEPPSKVAPLLKKAGIDEKKARNFFYYYKFYILGALLLAVALFYGIRSYINRVEPDFNIAFIGRFSYLDASDKLSADIKKNVPEIKEPNIDGAFLTSSDLPDNQQPAGNQQQTANGQQSQPAGNQSQTGDGQQTQPAGNQSQAGNGQQSQPAGNQQQIDAQQEYAMEMKATVLIAAGDIDVFIVDRDRYFQYARQGIFLSLDEIAPRIGADIDKNNELITKIEEDKGPLDKSETSDKQSPQTATGAAGGTEAQGSPDIQPAGTTVAGSGAEGEKHLYGIDISDSKVLKATGVLGEDKIAAIFAGTKRLDKAEKLIEYLMK